MAYNMTGWTRVSPALGSQAGGVYEGLMGERYYVKVPKTEQHARNEVLASRLYALAGIKAARYDFAKGPDGVLHIASPWLEGAHADLGQRLSDADYLAQIRKGFAVDAWLANWDVAGLVFDNIVSVHGSPVRVDPGGCLLFRAMGSPKGAAFGPVAGELDTLRTAPEAGKLFGSMTQEEIKESAKSLESISLRLVAETVESVGYDQAMTDHLVYVLLKRWASVIARTVS